MKKWFGKCKRNNAAFILLILFLTACSGKRQSSEEPTALATDDLIKINRELVRQDVEQNKAWAEQRGWNVSLLPNGLIYEFLRDEPGDKPQSGDKVSLSYVVRDVNHALVYAHLSPDKARSFVIDHDEVESGLNAMAKLMSTGDSVRLILPPHLAFGLLGDGNKIKPRASLIYYIKMVSVN